ncbi:MAG: hypothetical protein LM590_06535 [Thermofilum sp.]|nr:hypothetical protein [Thermofilum sp.]
MGVRVKLRITMGSGAVDAVALANTGFETDEPQLLVPQAFLIRSGVGLEVLGRPIAVEYDTAGGPTLMHVYPRACRVAVLEPDRASKEVEADLAVSLIEREVLMSDALIGELGVDIVNPKAGLWRFIDDTAGVIRRSYKPQLWY